MTAPRNPDDREDRDEQDLDESLERQQLDLPGDMEENRNLSGSSTWENLEEEAGNKNYRNRERDEGQS
jgi:hypothetical protein